MAKSKQEIITEIRNYIQNEGSGYRSWYVGIAKSPRVRLFSDHNVSENGGWWIYREASSSIAAREIESFFINTLGIDGGTGGGQIATKYVYAYKKTTTTNP